MKDTTRISMEKAELLRTASLEMHVDPTESENMALISRSTELSNAKRREPLPGAPTVDVLPPATRHGVPGTVICLEGYRCLQELDGKRKETTIYTGSACRKVTAPYVQSGVDNILRPALSCSLNLYRDLEVRLCLCSGLVCRLCVCLDRSADLGTPALLYRVQERWEF